IWAIDDIGWPGGFCLTKVLELSHLGARSISRRCGLRIRGRRTIDARARYWVIRNDRRPWQQVVILSCGIGARQACRSPRCWTTKHNAGDARGLAKDLVHRTSKLVGVTALASLLASALPGASPPRCPA